MKNNVRKIILFLLIGGILTVVAFALKNSMSVESGGVMVKGW